MEPSDTGWRAQAAHNRTVGRPSRGLRLALLIGLSGLACARAEPPAPAPPPPGPQAGTVVVETQPAGLELVADGAVRCRTPCTFRIDPGLHRLSIHKTGYMPWQESVEVGAGAEVKVSAALVASH